MFQNQFQIIIQSGSPEIEKIVHTIDLPEDSGVVITTVADYHEVWNENMIDTAVILDGKTDDLPEISREKGLVVYLLSVDEMGAVKQEQLAKADMLWVMTDERYQKDLLTIYYKKLLLFMKDVADNRKQKICFNTLIDSLPDLIWFKDRKGAHLIVNNGFCGAVEKTKEQTYKKGHYYIWDIPKEEYEQGDYVCLESEDIVMEARTTCLFDENVKTKGGMRLFKTYKSPLIDANEEIFGTCGFAHDVTELQNISKELSIVLNSLPFAVVIEDPKGIVISVNPEFLRYFPNEKLEEGQSFADWKRKLLEEKSVQNGENIEIELNEGEDKTVLMYREAPVIDVFGEALGKIDIFRDITIEKKFGEQTLYAATTDFLTGLNNRRSLFLYLEEKKSCRQMTIITLDLDNFKQVNDMYGHKEGDRALVETSRLLKECFPDDFIARLGGDEFIVVQSRMITKDELQKEVSHMMETMHAYYNTDDKFSRMTVSAGAAYSIIDTGLEHEIENLMQRSDKALYRAKESGKAKYVFLD